MAFSFLSRRAYFTALDPLQERSRQLPLSGMTLTVIVPEVKELVA